MHTVLDLDLDFFVWPIAHDIEGNQRLSDADYTTWSEEEVRDFLENRCSLKRDSTIPGHEIVEHDGAFFTWRRWLETGLLRAPFNVIHVDAHADLGLGEGGWTHLLSEFLARPVEQRAASNLVRPRGLTPGSYLAFAVACRWINDLKYVFPYRKAKPREYVLELQYEGGGTEIINSPKPEPSRAPKPDDLMPLVFRNFDTRSGFIELKRYDSKSVARLAAELRTNPPQPTDIEPAVPFTFIPADQFSFDGFTHMIFALSPAFTPPSADRLLPIIRSYFVEA